MTEPTKAEDNSVTVIAMRYFPESAERQARCANAAQEGIRIGEQKGREEVLKELKKCNGYEAWIGEVIEEMFLLARKESMVKNVPEEKSLLGNDDIGRGVIPLIHQDVSPSKAERRELQTSWKILQVTNETELEKKGKIAGLEIAVETTNFMISQSCQCDGNYVCVLHRLRECLQEDIKMLRGVD